MTLQDLLSYVVPQNIGPLVKVGVAAPLRGGVGDVVLGGVARARLDGDDVDGREVRGDDHAGPTVLRLGRHSL